MSESDRTSSNLIRSDWNSKISLPLTSEEIEKEESFEDIQSEQVTQMIFEEEKIKRNFFQRVGAILGLKKSKSETISILENVNITKIKLKDFALSKHELDRIQLPLLKNFSVQHLSLAVCSPNKNSYLRSR